MESAAKALSLAKTLVIKVGSALLIEDKRGKPARDWLSLFAYDVDRLLQRGQRVVLVSSGAVALGRRRLGLSRKKLSLEEKQAAAAAGQSTLMQAWEDAFTSFNRITAQILLTRNDTETRKLWLNGRATLNTLLELGAIPIVNENDTVATEEIRYGDNDRLAGRVAQMVSADLLVLLSDVDGLYTADPRREVSAQHIPLITELTPELMAMAEGANLTTGVGTGGMVTKLAAARIAADAGCATLIGLGQALKPDRATDHAENDRAYGPLSRIEQGARASLIHSGKSPLAAYKQWIAGGLAPMGTVRIDAGAVKALRSGKSLLTSGVVAISGDFDQGDLVFVLDSEEKEIARGLVDYDSHTASLIKGLRSEAIERVLGYSARAVLIHRDDLVLR